MINLKDNVWIEGFNSALKCISASCYYNENDQLFEEIYKGRTSSITKDLVNKYTSEVDFYPDDGFPLSVGYMVGKDDGKSTLYTTALKAIQELIKEPYCIIFKKK